MLSYTDIIKKSYYVTRRHLVLWVFGLFVIGGTNLNFLYYQNIPFKQWYMGHQWQDVAAFFSSHPGKLALLCLSFLLFSIVSVLLTNWSRIMLVLAGQSILKDNLPKIEVQFKKSRRFIWPVIGISLWTAALMLVVAAAIFLPLLFLDFVPSLQNLLLILGALIFLPLAFTISCVNIFVTFYIVAFNLSVPAAIKSGTDFFLSRWAQILGLVILLFIVYCAVFAAGVSLIFAARQVFDVLLLFLDRLNILAFSAIIPVLKFASSLLSWFLLAGLSVFFNQALLVLFLDLNTPVKAEEVIPQTVPAPAVLS